MNTEGQTTRHTDEIYGPEYFSGKRSFFYRLTGGYRNLARVFDHHAARVFRYATGGRLLDIGCAYGFLLERFEDDFETHGIDISNHAIKVAKERLKKSNLLVHDIAQQLPFADGFFDVVTAADVLEHVRNPKQVLKNVTRVLRPGGMLYVASPNNNLVRQLLYKIPDHLEHHVSLMHIAEMVACLERLGYEVLEKRTLLNVIFKIHFSSSIGPEMSVVARRRG
ncbi:MAG: class I SAM-dependent methyltransferase [Planctomycetia bacterium]|nr:class I SAM-dependent methyltransferase [Planctomycetia bacterium]